MSVNAFNQLPYLNPVLFFLTWGSVFGSQISLLFSQWFGQGRNRWFALHALTVLVTLATQRWMVIDPQNLPKDYTPWVWWSLAVGAISAGFAFRIWYSAVYIVLLPLLWVLIRVSEYGGSATPMHAVQDATYTFLMSAVFTALPQLLRYQARATDEANRQASESVAQQAYIDATEREQLRASAWVHDSVINTLETAIQAETPAQKLAAAQAARQAIQSLADYRYQPGSDTSVVTADSLFSALTQSIQTKAPDLEISVEIRNTLELSPGVANALTLATLQVVENSLQHAGRCNRKLKLRATESGLKIVVVDDGVGFRFAKSTKSKLGLKVAVIARVEDVGGKVHIDAAPHQGTTVVIEWNAHE
ncbi:MAG: sensor histidine kinase [Micrococcales bacterium]